MKNNHVGPPTSILRPKVAIFPLALEHLVNPSLGLGLEAFVVEDIGESNQTLRVVWSAFPGVLAATITAGEPIALADVCVELLGMTGQAVALQLELMLQRNYRLCPRLPPG